MSAIKKFFEKKKLEAKFKMAGEGRRLGDMASAEAENQRRISEANRALSMGGVALHPSSSARAQIALSSQRRSAADAAMRRSDHASGVSGKDFDKKRSQAAIRAMAKKELQEEEKQKKKTAASDTKPLMLDEERPPHLDGVGGVFYKCPLIGPDILPKSAMKKKIRDFLYAQVETDDAGLTACLIIHTLNNDREKVRVGVDTLRRYLDNILQNPDAEKYKLIRKSNKAFAERVAPLEGHDIFLSSCGFDIVNIDGEEYWKYPEYKLDVDNLETMQVLKDALLSAEPINAELDRGVRILTPSQADLKELQLPADFFDLSAEEVKREQQSRTEEVERQETLRTKAMREKDEQKVKRKYRFAIIRIRFPDGLVLQGTFSVYEKFSSVMDFVMENLDLPLPFFLHDNATGSKLDLKEGSAENDKSLLDLNMVPAALLTFGWDPEVEEQIKAANCTGSPRVYLKADLSHCGGDRFKLNSPD